MTVWRRIHSGGVTLSPPPNIYHHLSATSVGYRTMCHHHKAVDLIAERYAESEDEDEAEAETDPETPTLTPPADD